jgi:spermidine/putrescine transport system ATP-binding protein
MIAGFELPDEGRILLQGDDVTTVAPNRRPLNMVFQHYALFPHMSIYDNVSFGLKVARVPRADHRERIERMLRVVELEGFEKRRIRQLSGGPIPILLRDGRSRGFDQASISQAGSICT